MRHPKNCFHKRYRNKRYKNDAMMTKPVCSYIALWSHKRTWNAKKKNSKILERKQCQNERKNKMESKKREGGRQSEREHSWRGLTVSLKWSLCLLWTASAKCWSLGWGRRFSSSKMSRIPTSLASTRSGNSNYTCISKSFMIQVEVQLYDVRWSTSMRSNILMPQVSHVSWQSLKYLCLTCL